MLCLATDGFYCHGTGGNVVIVRGGAPGGVPSTEISIIEPSASATTLTPDSAGVSLLSPSAPELAVIEPQTSVVDLRPDSPIVEPDCDC